MTATAEVMQVITAPDQKVVTPEESLVFIGAKRIPKGLQLTFKSKRFEDFIRSICTEPRALDQNADAQFFEKSTNPGWNGHMAYPISMHRGLEYTNFWGEELYRNYANLSFLRTRGLANGVTFELNGVYTQQMVDTWYAEAKNVILKTYLNFMKEIDMELLVSLRKVELFI